MVQRQVLTIDEQNFIAEPAERAKAKAAQVDSGMWGGIPGGI
jgi:hypothetical protein